MSIPKLGHLGGLTELGHLMPLLERLVVAVEKIADAAVSLTRDQA